MNAIVKITSHSPRNEGFALEQKIVKALAVTAEIMGSTLSENALVVMASDLKHYPFEAVNSALDRTRRECRGTLSLQAILERIDDGRPSADEAWGIVPYGEHETVVWTSETEEAYQAAYPLVAKGDRIAARQAFKQAYERLVSLARSQCKPIVWRVTLGSDHLLREQALKQAVEKKLLEREYARSLLASSSMKVTTGGHALLDAVTTVAGQLEQKSLPDSSEQVGKILKDVFGEVKSQRVVRKYIGKGSIHDPANYEVKTVPSIRKLETNHA